MVPDRCSGHIQQRCNISTVADLTQDLTDGFLNDHDNRPNVQSSFKIQARNLLLPENSRLHLQVTVLNRKNKNLGRRNRLHVFPNLSFLANKKVGHPAFCVPVAGYQDSWISGKNQYIIRSLILIKFNCPTLSRHSQSVYRLLPIPWVIGLITSISRKLAGAAYASSRVCFLLKRYGQN